MQHGCHLQNPEIQSLLTRNINSIIFLLSTGNPKKQTKLHDDFLIIFKHIMRVPVLQNHLFHHKHLK